MEYGKFDCNVVRAPFSASVSPFSNISRSMWDIFGLHPCSIIMQCKNKRSKFLDATAHSQTNSQDRSFVFALVDARCGPKPVNSYVDFPAKTQKDSLIPASKDQTQLRSAYEAYGSSMVGAKM